MHMRGMEVNVAGEPRNHIAVLGQRGNNAIPQNSIGRTRGSVVVDDRDARMMREHHGVAISRSSEFCFEPRELLFVDRSLPATVRIDRVEADEPQGTEVGGVVGGSDRVTRDAWEIPCFEQTSTVICGD